ncbi:MAG TPA: peptidoglycan DD-metalloendopeptidase family protein [Rhodoglobus sp.]|nr:peptidoglycan DD-metalloendopeptidase family protein [Rhodoglobus sp.]
MGIEALRDGRRAPLRRSSGIRLAAIAAALALIITGTVAADRPAYAADYPSWDDVQNARNDVAAKQAMIDQIRAQLVALQAEVERTQADVEAKGNAYQEADNKFQAKAAEAEALQRQADEANEIAASSTQRAGQMAAQLARGGSDLSMNLFVSSDPDDLLYGLGMSGRLSEQADLTYQKAQQDRNTAQALSDTAEVARTELEVLRKDAEAKFAEAQVAAEAAAVALQESQAHRAELEVQLQSLEQNLSSTEAEFEKGEAERRAAEAAARAAAEQAARDAIESGQVSNSGWTRPSGGWLSSTFGWRVLGGSSNFHKGIDLAAGCGAGIWAASAGVVSYAAEGWNGGYGNYIIVDHGGGISTAYGHIMPGGIYVYPGQYVGVGEQIASVGTTGQSTGCHLHFETRVGGVAQDPLGFMGNRGVYFG